MGSLRDILARIEGSAALRPAYPPVAVDLEQQAVSLVRLKARRGRRPLLEAHLLRALDAPVLPDSIFQPTATNTPELVKRLSELFEASGTRPGRVSLVLPDNLAKISLISLPERPSGLRELDELVRGKMRRAVPFRLEDATLSYQVFAGEGREVMVLVVLVQRALVERLEQAVEAAGARPGLIDLSTPNLLNVLRDRVETLQSESGDVALLNCAERYFSLVISRGGRVIFFRCKTFVPNADGSSGPNGSLAREIGHSFSYYQEKLGGVGIGSILVRSTSLPISQIVEQLRPLGCDRIEPLVLTERVELADGVALDDEAAHRLAPAIGAAIARAG